MDIFREQKWPTFSTPSNSQLCHKRWDSPYDGR